jgi:hypothetical protein
MQNMENVVTVHPRFEYSGCNWMVEVINPTWWFSPESVAKLTMSRDD